jgi:hypothetical protein
MGCCGWKASDREAPADAALPQPVEVLEHHRAVAESALDAATCGRPLCRIGDGPDVSRPKYAEGGLAAVSELQRKLRSVTGSDALTVAEDLLASWEAERHASEARGPAWIAYRNGGVAQLRAIVDDLGAAAP